MKYFLILVILLIPFSFLQSKYKIGYYDGCYDLMIQEAKNKNNTMVKNESEKDFVFTYQKHYAEAVCKFQLENK